MLSQLWVGWVGWVASLGGGPHVGGFSKSAGGFGSRVTKYSVNLWCPHNPAFLAGVSHLAVFKQLGDAVGELQYLFCTIATPESAKPLRAGDLCDWLGTLSRGGPLTPHSTRCMDNTEGNRTTFF